ncbi:hypothetical protein MANI_110415 [Metarhizium anisopliae]|nr:hypothetical protein MANI_110415 [Metarhizium anisopliae]
MGSLSSALDMSQPLRPSTVQWQGRKKSHLIMGVRPANKLISPPCVFFLGTDTTVGAKLLVKLELLDYSFFLNLTARFRKASLNKVLGNPKNKSNKKRRIRMFFERNHQRMYKNLAIRVGKILSLEFISPLDLCFFIGFSYLHSEKNLKPLATLTVLNGKYSRKLMLLNFTLNQVQDAKGMLNSDSVNILLRCCIR